MPSGRQKFARQQAAQATAPPPPGELAQAVVQAVSTATPPVVTVTYQGSNIAVPHMAAYTPNVGDVVAMGRYCGNWLILGRPVGFPS